MRHDTYEKNHKGRDFVIGDLHGSMTAFDKTLVKIGFDQQKDRMFAVGDLIDRGEDSKKALELTQLPWFHSVKGNHEDMLIKSKTDGHYMRMRLHNGGEWGLNESIKTIDYLRSLAQDLPTTITIDGQIGISHAQCPSVQLDSGTEFDWDLRTHEDQYNKMLWGRKQIKKFYGNCHGIKKTYHGHTPTTEIVTNGNSHWIDTGACWGKKGGYLTCVELEY